MNSIYQYDNLVAIYDSWSNADPAAALTLDFYIEISSSQDHIVELGVGNGRIALEFAKRGKRVTGVDISGIMIGECEKKARSLGLSQFIQLVRSDIRDFCLAEPAKWIIMPFRTIGHLLSTEDKRDGLRNIYNRLAPGGVLVFDHYVFNEKWARSFHGVPRLMSKSVVAETAKTTYVWDTYLYYFDEQRMDCTITLEEVNVDGSVVTRRHYPLNFSWIDPIQVRTLLTEVGFDILDVFGSFRKEPMLAESKEQIWVVRRPN
jgi:SAM-dependent methyltransferase